jgi:hypothetical protein
MTANFNRAAGQCCYRQARSRTIQKRSHPSTPGHGFNMDTSACSASFVHVLGVLKTRNTYSQASVKADNPAGCNPAGCLHLQHHRQQQSAKSRPPAPILWVAPPPHDSTSTTRVMGNAGKQAHCNTHPSRSRRTYSTASRSPPVDLHNAAGPQVAPASWGQDKEGVTEGVLCPAMLEACRDAACVHMGRPSLQDVRRSNRTAAPSCRLSHVRSHRPQAAVEHAHNTAGCCSAAQGLQASRLVLRLPTPRAPLRTAAARSQQPHIAVEFIGRHYFHP